MHKKPSSPLSLQPLHGVELIFNNQPHTHNEILPFHLNVTINYDTQVESTSLPIWTMLDEGTRYSSLVELYKEDNKHRLAIKCEGEGSFTFDRSDMFVDWQLAGTGFEHYLQSLGLAAWLELQGVPCIHANAITLDDNAALIIAPSRTGKSTLTTHLTGHQFKLMTDDMAAVHATGEGTFTIYPSWPKVRLWPDMADSLIGMQIDNRIANRIDNDSESVNNTNKRSSSSSNSVRHPNKPLIAAPQKKQVHQKFAKFEIEFDAQNNIWRHQPAQLKAIYYLERLEETANEDCTIERLGASNALMILLQNSMLADGYVKMGIEVARLTNLAKIVESIPLYKISYRSGLSNLDKVAVELKKHLNSLSS
ncbi:MAG: hypothetical protein ACJASL_001675 [Paraglaciecola sp.]|jgi:hypothetical protein